MIVVALENGMMLEDPEIFVRQVRAQDGDREFTMIFGCKRIADVVKQRHDNGFFISSIAIRACRSLQRMLITIDLVADPIALQLLQLSNHAIGNVHVEPLEFFSRNRYSSSVP